MSGKIKTFAFRYGLPLAAFALILYLPTVFQKLFSFSLDLTLLIILLLIATSWYAGMIPGFLIAVVFEFVLDYFSSAPYTGKSVIITINRMVLFVSIVLFASSRRKAEKKLVEQREVLKVTISSIGDAVISADLNGKISFINPTAENLTGWTSAEACGKPIEEIFKIVNEETQQPIESPFSAVIREGLTVGLANHTVLISKTGASIPIEDSGAPIKDADGKIIGVIIVFHDVTQRRQIEKDRELLLKREHHARTQAEAAGRLKDDFLATVSHELRTPLSAILGWSALLKKSEFEEKSVRNGLEVIERNARMQGAIINDILDISEILNGNLELDKKPIEITSIIKSSVENFQRKAEENRLELTAVIDRNIGLVYADGVRLRQITNQLISNAVKFSHENGKIEVCLEKSSEFVKLSISDDGIGIDEQFLPHIFDKFRQEDASTTRHHGGLGLGLSIVRHLVNLHGGTITAESEGTNKGAVFTVLLPLYEPKKEVLNVSKGENDLKFVISES